MNYANVGVSWTLAVGLTWLLANPPAVLQPQHVVLLSPTLIQVASLTPAAQKEPSAATKPPASSIPTHPAPLVAPPVQATPQPVTTSADLSAPAAQVAPPDIAASSAPIADTATSSSTLALAQPDLPAPQNKPAAGIAALPTPPSVAPSTSPSPTSPTATPSLIPWDKTTGLLLNVEVDSQGHVLQVVITRSGGDPLRDAMLVMKLKKTQLTLNPPIKPGQTLWINYAFDYKKTEETRTLVP